MSLNKCQKDVIMHHRQQRLAQLDPELNKPVWFLYHVSDTPESMLRMLQNTCRHVLEDAGMPYEPEELASASE